MLLWARTRRFGYLLLLAVSAPVLGSIVAGTSVMLPSLTSGSPFGSVPASVLLAMVLPLSLGTSLHGATPLLGSTASRPISQLDTAACLLCLAVSVSTCALLGIVGWNEWQIYVRSSVTLLAVSLLGLPLAGYRYQSIVPVLYVFFAAVFGRGPGGKPAVWGWVIDPQLQPWHLPAAAVLLGAGATVAALLGPRYLGKK
ncbi:hypothetical protein ABIB56_001491 [Glaciihabitans sp. UYNi722]